MKPHPETAGGQALLECLLLLPILLTFCIGLLSLLSHFSLNCWGREYLACATRLWPAVRELEWLASSRRHHLLPAYPAEEELHWSAGLEGGGMLPRHKERFPGNRLLTELTIFPSSCLESSPVPLMGKGERQSSAVPVRLRMLQPWGYREDGLMEELERLFLAGALKRTLVAPLRQLGLDLPRIALDALPYPTRGEP